MSPYETHLMSSVRHEIKSQLAKLLATEDLIVEHKNCPTAQFNVETRVLVLPIWDKASNDVYDMLVGHEVGHALFTPNEDLPDGIPHSFVNIVEDVRIEKLMKRRYAGLAKYFYRGYRELTDEDFFELEGVDISNMNLADRVNLHFKIGNFVDIEFNSEEKEILKEIWDCETFEDVLSAAETLYNYCKKKPEPEQKQTIELPPTGSGQDDDQPQPQMSSDEAEEPDESEEESDQQEVESESPVGGVGGGQDYEPTVETVDRLSESLKDLTSRFAQENNYVEIPQVDLDKVIVPNADIHERCRNEWDEWKNYRNDCFELSDQAFYEFKKSAQKEVNYLVKEFECRKAASSYSRATTTRTGVLDTTKLHTYKYNEDLFKKVSVIPDGKNHGLVFVLDWSGSMAHVMEDTIKQLYNLIWFCRKVSIPFDVYAFTNEYPKQQFMDYSYEKKDGLVCIDATFSMMNLFTSSVNNKTLETQMINVFRIARALHYYGCTYPIPTGLTLSGTPLCESFITLHQILPQFQKKNGVEKVQCIVLSDGEACGIRYHKKFSRPGDEEFLGLGRTDEATVLRDRRSGATYNMTGMWWKHSDVFLRQLRDTFKTVNFIGIRILEGRDVNSFIKRYIDDFDQQTVARMSWKKNRSCTIKTSNYNSYFALSSSCLSQDSDFDVKDDATKSQIKSAFIKSLRTKKMNKKILGEFIELVA